MPRIDPDTRQAFLKHRFKSFLSLTTITMLDMTIEKTWDELVQTINTIHLKGANPFADDSVESHAVINKFERPPRSNNNINNHSYNNYTPSQSLQPQLYSQSRSQSQLTCYYCRKTGHIARNCFKKQRDQHRAPPVNSYNSQRQSASYNNEYRRANYSTRSVKC
jgi:Zinc knuckle